MTLEQYIYDHIVPQYDHFDAAHHHDHALSVIERSLALAQHYPEVDKRMVLTAAACHDLGLCGERKTHHLTSGRIIRADEQLRQWFTNDEIETIACAAEDHRASSDHAPRSLYGMIVAEADRLIDPHTVVMRTVQYGLAHYPELNYEQQYERTRQHLLKKYSEQGYIRLWLPESPNAQPLKELRHLIANEEKLRCLFNTCYQQAQAEKH